MCHSYRTRLFEEMRGGMNVIGNIVYDSNFNESEIIRDILKGDKELYIYLVNKYKNIVYSVVYKIIGNYHTAEDITQETFISAYMKLDKLRDGDKFIQWICASARNKSYNYLSRSKYLRLETELSDEISEKWSVSPEQSLFKQEQNTNIAKAFDNLTPKLKKTAVLYFINKYSQKKIAQILDISENLVKSRIHDAREYLKKELIFMKENNKNLSENFDEIIRREITYLYNYYHLNNFSYDGYDEIYEKVVKKAHEMPESKEKHKFLAEIYYYSRSEDNQNKAFEEAVISGNSEIIVNIVVDKYINKDNDILLEKLDSEGLSLIENMENSKNEVGIINFWKGVANYKKYNFEEALKNWEEALNKINKDNIYYANTIAAIKLIKNHSEEINTDLYSTNVTGERYRYANGKVYFVLQPGFGGENKLWPKNTYQCLYYFCSWPDRILFDENMKIGDTRVSKENAEHTSTIISLNETVTVPAGTFDGCMKLILKENYDAEIYYAPNTGIVKFHVKTPIEEIYELCEYVSGNGKNIGSVWFPFREGDLYRYKNIKFSDDLYNQIIEYETIRTEGEYADFSVTNAIYIKKGWDNKTFADSDFYISQVDNYCDYKNFNYDKAVEMLKKAAQANSVNYAVDIAVGGIEYLTKFKNYYEKNQRIFPSSFNCSTIKKYPNLKHIFNECAISSFGPHRYGTRFEENKIFGSKIFRYLSILNGGLFDDKWKDGYSGTLKYNDDTVYVKAENVGTVTVDAGAFDNCLKVTIEAECKNKNGKYYFENYSFVEYGKKIYWFAPDIGIIKHECIWKETLSSCCELQKYRSVSTNGEYMPIYAGMLWIYKEKTLEDEYINETKYEIINGENDIFTLINSQTFVFSGTEEDYEEFKKNL